MRSASITGIFAALLLAGCGHGDDASSSTAPTASLPTTGKTAAGKQGGSQAMMAPAMQPNASAAPLEAGSAMKGK